MALSITRRRGQAVRIVDSYTGRAIVVRPVHFRSGKEGGRFRLEIVAGPGTTVELLRDEPKNP